ncbi:MAG: hypothetical protein ACOH1V_15200 [Stenotrophomonas sp.]
MKRNGLLVTVMTAIVVAMTPNPGVASSAETKTDVHYPEELHGFWIPESATCPLAGQSFDGDTVMHISAQLLYGYEDQSKPSAVALISSEPLAWRIESLMDVGPSGFYERDDPRIFVMSDGNVTVASKFHTDIYRKCAR